MRIFKSASGWDKTEQKWIQTCSIDEVTVTMETYCVELEKEVHDGEEIQEQEENYIPCPCIVCTRQREIEMQESLDEEHNACDDCTREGCHGCGEMDETEEVEISLEDKVNELVGEAFEIIMESGGCPSRISSALLEFGESMMDLGMEEMDKEQSENVTNIHIDSVNITDATNARDLIDQIEKYSKMQMGRF